MCEPETVWSSGKTDIAEKREDSLSCNSDKSARHDISLVMNAVSGEGMIS